MMLSSRFSYFLLLLIGLALTLLAQGAEPSADVAKIEQSLWRHDNLFAWEAAPYDAKKRSPEERAQMFERLGIKQYAYLSSAYDWDTMDDVNTSQLNVDAEIEAMQRHGIDIIAWFFWINTNEPATAPKLRYALESFKRHNIHPHIWVTNSYAFEPRTQEEWAPYLPKGVRMPMTIEEYNSLSDSKRETVDLAFNKLEQTNYPKSPKERVQRVTAEALRIKALVELAAPYGCKVDIYNHRGWFGMIDNELAIIDRLAKLGIGGVGMVYNFSHSRDKVHDDSRNFERLWNSIRDRVFAVNVTGLSGVDNVV